jgi:glucose-6-phosphate isomerase
MQLKDAISKMFSGDKINETEGRAVLAHCFERFFRQRNLVDGENIKPQIKRVLDHMKSFLKALFQEITKVSAEKKLQMW